LGQSRDGCIRWGPRVPNQRRFWGFSIPIGLVDAGFQQKFIPLVCEKFIIFQYGQYIVGNVSSLAFRRNIRFEIKVRVYEKYSKV